MKKSVVLLVGAVMAVSALNAQIVEEGESALVYYSPKTTITLDFTYVVETQEAGIFAAYAQSLLGAESFVKQTSSKCTLQDVRIGTTTGTDYKRPHKVSADAGIPLLLNINERGVLAGYNTTPKEEKKSNFRPQNATKEEEQSLASAIAPYPAEVLKNASLVAKANAAAKQIFHLRETKMYLLSGEVEKEPADGEAMRLVLEELDRQEQALTELFVGKKSTCTKHHQISFDPEGKVPALFFSEENGFTDADNIDADTVKVAITLFPQQFIPAQEDAKSKKKKAVELSPIVYNLPGSGNVTVRYKDSVLGSRTVTIAQLGIDVPLSKDLFMGPELPVIVINEKTGNIISISK